MVTSSGSSLTEHDGGGCDSAVSTRNCELVDEMDDAVNKAYAAFPTRLYLVGLDGRVVYAGGLGPFGFKPAELGEAIDKYPTRVNVAADQSLLLFTITVPKR